MQASAAPARCLQHAPQSRNHAPALVPPELEPHRPPQACLHPHTPAMYPSRHPSPQLQPPGPQAPAPVTFQHSGAQQLGCEGAQMHHPGQGQDPQHRGQAGQVQQAHIAEEGASWAPTHPQAASCGWPPYRLRRRRPRPGTARPPPRWSSRGRGSGRPQRYPWPCLQAVCPQDCVSSSSPGVCSTEGDKLWLRCPSQ